MKFLYWEKVARDPGLERVHYYLGSVQVRVVDCPGEQCDRVVWEIENDAVWREPLLPPDLVPLPKAVEYGELIDGMHIVTSAESLERDVTYSVVIGIIGLDERYGDKIHFAAQARFRLTEDGNGNVQVEDVSGRTLIP